MSQINGYNILFRQGEKLFAGTTSNTFTLTPKVKESLTKEDKGTTNKIVTGEVLDFVYGDPAPGNTVQKGKMIITSYSETTNADGEATYSLSCSAVSKLEEEVIPQE